jgi:hypothetical protein
MEYRMWINYLVMEYKMWIIYLEMEYKMWINYLVMEYKMWIIYLEMEYRMWIIYLEMEYRMWIFTRNDVDVSEHQSWQNISIFAVPHSDFNIESQMIIFCVTVSI